MKPRNTGGAIDILGSTRRLVEIAFNETMDVEANEACMPDDNSRNAYRERKLIITVGTLNLRILKLHLGSYFPENIFERCGCTNKAIIIAVCKMYANGVSSREVAKTAHECLPNSSAASVRRSMMKLANSGIARVH